MRLDDCWWWRERTVFEELWNRPKRSVGLRLTASTGGACVGRIRGGGRRIHRLRLGSRELLVRLGWLVLVTGVFGFAKVGKVVRAFGSFQFWIGIEIVVGGQTLVEVVVEVVCECGGGGGLWVSVRVWSGAGVENSLSCASRSPKLFPFRPIYIQHTRHNIYKQIHYQIYSFTLCTGSHWYNKLQDYHNFELHNLNGIQLLIYYNSECKMTY